MSHLMGPVLPRQAEPTHNAEKLAQDEFDQQHATGEYEHGRNTAGQSKTGQKHEGEQLLVERTKR